MLEAVAVLDQGRLADLGPLLDASHVSMRDDFEITVPTVDLAVETAREAGALGARMTGGGFGGCIIALVPAGSSDAVAARVGEAFAAAGYAAPTHFLGRPSAGAAPDRLTLSAPSGSGRDAGSRPGVAIGFRRPHPLRGDGTGVAGCDASGPEILRHHP